MSADTFLEADTIERYRSAVEVLAENLLDGPGIGRAAGTVLFDQACDELVAAIRSAQRDALEVRGVPTVRPNRRQRRARR